MTILKSVLRLLPCIVCVFVSCSQPESNKQVTAQAPAFNKGEFGFDLQFLEKQDEGMIVLKDGASQLIVSPKYQAKVFTSTAQGDHGYSFGWINYKAFGNKPEVHMNAYGGENRLWLGPEGGKFSLFFPPDSSMIYDHWKTPAPIDTEPWIVKSKDSNSVIMYKEMNLVNYKNTKLSLKVERSIKILTRPEIMSRLGIAGKDSISTVGYETSNKLINESGLAWTETTGMLCIWILDMFKPSTATVIVVPFKNANGEKFSDIATTNYFGQIPADRIKHNDSVLVFKADGKSRGKLGIKPNKAKPMAGSYDAENKVLTIIQFEVDGQKKYLNQEWNTTKPSFSGDAVNAYNDGPLANGTQMGPFYEIESVSPAAFLKGHESLVHKHAVFHFTGNEKDLNDLSTQLLGISVKELNNIFSGENK
jgi:hypothetical protein